MSLFYVLYSNVKITLIVPPSPFLIDQFCFPFLGPLVIGALAREYGHEVSVIDMGNEADFIPQADLVGFYSLAANHPIVCRLLRRVKLEQPNAITALGGPHANTAPQHCIDDGFDYVVVSDQGGGGGEAGFLKLLTLPPEKIIKEASRVNGVKYQNDRWPLPARDLIDLRKYKYYIDGERATSIVTSAGCAWACVYCAHWAGYRKIEMKSPERVREEIRGIKRDYGWRGIMKYDDEINLRLDFLTEYLPMIKKEDIVWRAFFKNGPKLTRPDVFKAMAESGCRSLCTGAETANVEMLKTIRKGATLENNSDFVRLCVANKIKPKVFTQVGLPGESPDTVKELRNWLVQMASEGLADADVTITTPYEGTPIFDHPEQFDLKWEKPNYSKDTVLYKTVPGQYQSYVETAAMSKADLIAARQWVESEFRSAAGLAPLGAGKDDG